LNEKKKREGESKINAHCTNKHKDKRKILSI